MLRYKLSPGQPMRSKPTNKQSSWTPRKSPADMRRACRTTWCCTLVLASAAAGSTLANPNYPYTIDWVRQLGSDTTDVASSVAVDPEGNVIIGGWTNGDFDGHQSQGGHDYVLAKFTPEGEKLWSRQFGTSTTDFGYSIANDNAGNTFITGSTQGSFDGTYLGGVSDMFLAKYDPAGNRLWFKQFGSVNRDSSKSVAVDATGDAYVTGFMDEKATLGLNDAFLIKFDPMGNKVWSRQLGTDITDSGQSIAVDLNGDIYIGGDSWSGIDGQPYETRESVAFLAKYDQAGNRLWVQQIGNQQNINARRVTIDANNNAYLSGDYSGELEGVESVGHTDLFIAKFSSAGERLWLQQFGTEERESNYGLATDTSGRIYMTMTNSFTLSHLVELNPDGSILLTEVLDESSVGRVSEMIFASPDTLYLAGPAHIGLGDNVSAGDADAYVVKLVVPEPASLTIIGIGVTALLSRRRG